MNAMPTAGISESILLIELLCMQQAEGRSTDKCTWWVGATLFFIAETRRASSLVTYFPFPSSSSFTQHSCTVPGISPTNDCLNAVLCDWEGKGSLPDRRKEVGELPDISFCASTLPMNNAETPAGRIVNRHIQVDHKQLFFILFIFS